LSDTENVKVFGKCNNPFGHGHNYVLEVTVAGPVDETTGRVADTARLDELVMARVVGPFDHHDLNSEVSEFARLVPTSENLTAIICRRLQDHWKDAFPGCSVRLDNVRVFETERNIIELSAGENP
jgi:6-pyruvoyltetrahydropterin/6-carboxytetrahydropterin synthase